MYYSGCGYNSDFGADASASANSTRDVKREHVCDVSGATAPADPPPRGSEVHQQMYRLESVSGAPAPTESPPRESETCQLHDSRLVELVMRSRASQGASCTKGHPLRERRMSDEYECDACSSDIHKRQMAHICSKCEYVLCGPCLASQRRGAAEEDVNQMSQEDRAILLELNYG